MKDNKRGIHELYTEDPVAADELAWGRKSDPVTRRGFLTGGGLVAMSAAVGASIPFAHLMPGGLIPAALAQTDAPFEIPGKEGLIILNDRPINAETPAHLLDDRITPAKHLFVRNNGRPPAMDSIDPQTWRLEIGGESAFQEMSFSIGQLKGMFEHYTYQLQIECGGNGRSEFVPPAAGNQWSVGAVGCPEWTGVRLKDVLEHVGIADDALGGYVQTTEDVQQCRLPATGRSQQDDELAGVQLEIDAAVDRAHPAPLEKSIDAVLAVEGLPHRLLFERHPVNCDDL